MTKFVSNSLLTLKFAAYDCAYASFPWKLNRYSYGVQFEINCTALDQSKLSNFVECTISPKIRSVVMFVNAVRFLCLLNTQPGPGCFKPD